MRIATLVTTLIAGALFVALSLNAFSTGRAQAGTPADAESPPILAQAAAEADYAFELQTAFTGGIFAFVGVGGDIDGVVNPDLRVPEGATVSITLTNTDGMEHDFVADAFGVASDSVFVIGESSTVTFTVGGSGQFEYWCSIPGHRQIGMEGRIVVGDPAVVQVEEAPSLAKDPADLPGPIGDRGPATIDLDLTTTERLGRLADGSNYTFWTFNDTVPGPFLRVRVGDTVNVNLHNDASSRYAHSIDFHAVTGPGGGAAVTQTAPGQTTSFSFKALNPGLYVYHCATASVPHHITQGMYGLILVEPEEGLAEVDHEFYVMQGELYTIERFGSRGHLSFDIEKMLDERAEYLFFNGAPDALTAQYPLRAEVGDTVRIFFGVGGPNYVSSFHVIGEIFDRVHVEGGSLINENVQSTLVPTGGSTIVEFTLDVPGRYILVDHSLSRMERGLVGFLEVSGEENPEIFHGVMTEGHGH